MNMNNLMAQAQKMQKDIETKQNQIYSTEYIGNSELVDVVIMGDKSIKSINIKNKTTLDTDDLEILEDMIKIAFNDAFAKIDNDVETKLGMYGKKMGGLF